MLTQQFLSKIFGNLIASFEFSSVFRDIRVTYSAFRFPLREFDENITTRVEIGIFSIPIAYWTGTGIFKQNRDGWTVCDLQVLHRNRASTHQGCKFLSTFSTNKSVKKNFSSLLFAFFDARSSISNHLRLF